MLLYIYSFQYQEISKALPRHASRHDAVARSPYANAKNAAECFAALLPLYHTLVYQRGTFGRSIVIFARLFLLFVFSLLFLALAVTLLALELLLPKLVGGVALDAGEDDLEHV